MIVSWKTMRMIVVAINCLTIFEGCGSSSVIGVGSALVTPSQVAVTSPSSEPTTANFVPTGLVPTLPSVTPFLFTPLPTIQPDSWQGHWLESKLCKPPCWEKIIPGQTNLTEAKSLLNASGLTGTVINKVFDAKATRGKISWSWKASLGLGEKAASEGGYIYYDNTGSQLVDIVAPNLYISYRFSNIIKIYGEPEYVIAQGFYAYPEATTPSYSLGIVYLTQGFLLYAEGLTDKRINLDGNTSLGKVLFFTPSSEGFSKLERNVSGFLATKYLIKWQGFRDFGYYCRNVDKPAC